MPAPYPLSDYMDKITSAYADLPNYTAVVEALLTPGVALQETLVEMLTLFDIDTATGVQLDQIGQWVNRSREISIPLPNVFFSLDSDPLGLDRGIWFNPYANTSGLTSLDDDHYRLLLRAKIAANSWKGTLPDSIEILNKLFSPPIADPTKTFVFIQDISGSGEAYIGLSGILPSVVTQSLIIDGYISLRQLGKKLNYAITSVDGAPLFGLDCDNQYVAGLDDGAWATVGEINPLP